MSLQSSSFFLTEADTERLNIRGSRDPLGLVPLWGSFGRKVVGNLTTASNTVRGFTTLLLGFHFAERLAPSGPDREAVRLATVLKFEQLAGYARFIRNKDGNMRGITQIKRRLDEDGRRVPIGAARDRQILSNQKTYGLWGLYTIPSIDSGLLLRQDLVLSELGRRLIEQEYLPVFGRHKLGDGDVIAKILEKDRSDLEPDGKHSAVFDAVAEVMAVRTRKVERSIYHDALVRGGREGARTGWQPRFAELVEKHLPDSGEFDADSLDRLITAASKKEADAPLAHHLERIKHLEAVLVAMANLFGFLQDRARWVVAEVSKDIASQWSKGLRHINVKAIEEMQPDITKEYDDKATGKRFVDFAEAVHAGRFDDAVTLVLDQNRFVMNARNKSQPWIQVIGKKLQVRYRDESQIELAPPKELARAWRNGFYLNPLKQVSDELRKSA